MGCKELQITDYYRLTPTTANPETHTGFSAGSSETAYSRFKPVVSVSMSNYRYYSPELGRWLSRDPIYTRGSIAWLHFNKEDIVKEVVNLVEKLTTLIRFTSVDEYHAFSQKVCNILQDLKLFLETILINQMTGINLNQNLYMFVSNSPINTVDSLGLQQSVSPPSSYQKLKDIFKKLYRDIILGDAFYEHGVYMGKNGDCLNKRLYRALALKVMIFGFLFMGIGGAIIVDTAGLAALLGLPVMFLGFEMIIWGYRMWEGLSDGEKCKTGGFPPPPKLDKLKDQPPMGDTDIPTWPGPHHGGIGPAIDPPSGGGMPAIGGMPAMTGGVGLRY